MTKLQLLKNEYENCLALITDEYNRHVFFSIEEYDEFFEDENLYSDIKNFFL